MENLREKGYSWDFVIHTTAVLHVVVARIHGVTYIKVSNDMEKLQRLH